MGVATHECPRVVQLLPVNKMRLLTYATLFSPRYRQAAFTAIGTQLGTNPMSMSFITGLGERSPLNPTCEVCLADDVSEPYVNTGIPTRTITIHSTLLIYYYQLVLTTHRSRGVLLCPPAVRQVPRHSCVRRVCSPQQRPPFLQDRAARCQQLPVH